MFLFVYFSTMALFYLLGSILWKRLGSNKIIYIMHTISIVLSVIILYLNNTLYYFLINIGIFLVFLAIIQSSKKYSTDKGHISGVHSIYITLAFFWTLNILDILLPNFFQTTQLIIYLFSISAFLIILYKVLKKVGC